MGHDSKGARKYGNNSEGTGSYVQGGGAVGDIIWQRELGGDRGDAQGPDGVPTSGGATDHGMEAKRGAGVEWEYPSIEKVMESAGLHPIGV